MPRFAFAFDPVWRLPLLLLGVSPERAFAEVGEEGLTIRFGPWLLRTPIANVTGTTVTGPYAPWKAIGPHLSLADRGVTFGTNTRKGVCVRFATPVPALAPGGFLPHPGATVTVADIEGLVRALGKPQDT
ncbi:hypothetical protein GCM10010517_28120 [Streptosporangium fragile]|uniref:Uncharacterized protein n=1 Tax=Streptosporangium fragile TaxID=46186 RepID=A0ABN3VVY4_9ACTN